MNNCAELINEWRRRARKAFQDADREPDLMGQRLIRHAATCYCNCALELQAAISQAPKDKPMGEVDKDALELLARDP